jgi:hypothetical protein
VVVAPASVLEAVARSKKEFPRGAQAGSRLIGAGTCPACSGKLHALDYHPWALCERCLQRVVPPSGLAEIVQAPQLAHTAPQFMPISAMESGRREAPRALLLGGAVLFFLISWLLFTPPSEGEAMCTAAKQDRSLSVSSVRKACERWLWGNAAMVACAVFGGVLLARGLRRHPGSRRAEP